MAKEDVPSPGSDLNWTPIFEWYMVGCESKHGYQFKNMRGKEIQPCAQNLLTFIDVKVNMIGGRIWSFISSRRIFTLKMNRM